MPQLRTDDFTFGGESLSSYGFRVVNPQSNENTRIIGLSRSISKSENILGQYNIDKITQTTPTLDIYISKLDEGGNPQPISTEDIENINLWLFSPVNYKELIATDENKDIVYFGIFVEATQYYFDNNVGYIHLQFELDSNHAYGTVEKTTKTVDQEVEFYIDLIDSVAEYYTPDVEFNVAQGTSFSIANLTLGETMEFKELDSKSRKGKVYGEGCWFMISDTDSTVNMRAKSNKTFLRLKRGRNKIKITGNGTFSILVQPKIALQ